MTGVVGARGAARIVDEHTDPAPLTALVEQSAANIYFNPCQQLRFLLALTLQVPGLSTERGKPLAEFIRGIVNTTSLGARFSSGEVIEEANLSDLQEFGSTTYGRLCDADPKRRSRRCGTLRRSRNVPTPREWPSLVREPGSGVSSWSGNAIRDGHYYARGR